MNKQLEELVKFGYLKEAVIANENDATKIDASLPQNVDTPLTKAQKENKAEMDKMGTSMSDMRGDDEETEEEPSEGEGTVSIPEELIPMLEQFLDLAKQIKKMMPKKPKEEKPEETPTETQPEEPASV